MTVERADECVAKLATLGFKVGAKLTLEQLEAYLAGESSDVYEFNDEVMTKQGWIDRFVARMVNLGAATPEFARADAEASFDPAIWGLCSPEEAADEEISCWGD